MAVNACLYAERVNCQLSKKGRIRVRVELLTWATDSRSNQQHYKDDIHIFIHNKSYVAQYQYLHRYFLLRPSDVVAVNSAVMVEKMPRDALVLCQVVILTEIW